MNFDLPHVASRVYGTPLLIARPKLYVILSVLNPRLQGESLTTTGNPPATNSGLRITTSAPIKGLAAGLLTLGRKKMTERLWNFSDLADCSNRTAE
jgi:hypothetical protein